MRLEVDAKGNITEHEDAPIIKRSKEEIEAKILSLKIQEANQYLAQTDWVNLIQLCLTLYDYGYYLQQIQIY